MLGDKNPAQLRKVNNQSLDKIITTMNDSCEIFQNKLIKAYQQPILYQLSTICSSLKVPEITIKTIRDKYGCCNFSCHVKTATCLLKYTY